MADPLDTIESLSDSIGSLEDILEPLFQKTLAQNEENLEPTQKAKLNVLLTYVIQNLVLTYLKTKGIDASKHPVSEELKRVKEYFDKIKEAENPAARTMLVDSAAANRFIKAAISGIKSSSQGEPALIPVSMPSVGKHTRFEHSLRPMEPSQRQEESDEDDDEEQSLQIIDDASDNEEKGKGKGKEVDNSSSGGKRRRMDPFAGYSAEGSETTSRGPAQSSRKRQKQSKSKGSTS